MRRIDDPLGAHGHVGHLAAFTLDLAAGAEHGRMLDRGRDHMLAVTGPHSAQHGQVVRLGAAADEDDFLWPAVQKRGGLAASHLQSLLG